ncbi:MAG: hypothetical protein ACI8PP_002017 [Candidatus Pseudothioglobus sp.]|jgi:hypothetical protein
MNEVPRVHLNVSHLLKVNCFDWPPRRSASCSIFAKPNLLTAPHHAPPDSGKAPRRSFIQLIKPPLSKNITCRDDMV